MGYLIDSSVIIAAARGRLLLPNILTSLGDEPVAISAITASELLHGIHRSNDVKVMQRRQEFVESVLQKLPVIPFELDIARVHAQLWAQMQSNGQMIGIHDLQIAATAVAIDYGVLTLNEREFRLVPKLRVITPESS